VSNVVITSSDREKIEKLIYELVMVAEKHIRESKENRYAPYVGIAISYANRAEDLVYNTIITIDILKDMPYAINRLFTRSAVLYVYYNVIHNLVTLDHYTEEEIKEWIRREVDYIIDVAGKIGVRITWYDGLYEDVKRLALYRE